MTLRDRIVTALYFAIALVCAAYIATFVLSRAAS